MILLSTLFEFLHPSEKMRDRCVQRVVVDDELQSFSDESVTSLRFQSPLLREVKRMKRLAHLRDDGRVHRDDASLAALGEIDHAHG